MLGFFICPIRVWAADNDIVISEIGAYETSDYEWIEIYNKGAETVNLTGWKFFENNTNHGLTSYQGDIIIDPNEYAVIANVAAKFKEKYPDFGGTILDSSWSSLDESGEPIALKNKSLSIIESFTYLPCPDTSLQRIDENLNDYTSANWQVHATSNSAGRANEFPTPPPADNPPADNPPADNPPADNPPADNPPADNPPADNPPADNPPENIAEAKSILINEFVSDPADTDTEWIELYNKNDFAVDLTGWQVLDGSGKATVLGGQIDATSGNPFFVVENPKGKLNNGGDAIILENDQAEIIDAVYYGNWQAPEDVNKAPVANDPDSVARRTDGLDTGDASSDFVITQTPTKNGPNQIDLLPSEGPAPVYNTYYVNQESTSPAPAIDYSKIIINELLPNPIGSNLTDEFIELKNIGSDAIDLNGCQLQDNSKKVYEISNKDLGSTTILPGNYLTLKRSITGLALNNDSDFVKFMDPSAKIIQTVKYSGELTVPENVSYARTDEGNWVWSTTPTDNATNIITLLNHVPIISIDCPKTGEIGALISCDASDSYDLENDALTFSWQIETKNFSEPIVDYQFDQSGTYPVTLTVSDGKLAATKTVKIKISKSGAETTSKNTSSKPKAVKAATTAKTSVAKTSSTNSSDTNSTDEVQGTVSALPNIFGKTIMYLAEPNLQLYMSKAKWPDLKLGDIVEASGVLVGNSGNQRLKLASAQSIQFVEAKDPPLPQEIKISEMDNSLANSLVKISGKLLNKTGNKFQIQDDSGEAQVYIYPNTKIVKTDFLEGDDLIVTGIVRLNNEILQILPRQKEDLVKNIPAVKQDPLTLPSQPQSRDILQYLFTSAVFLGAGTAIAFKYRKKAKSWTRWNLKLKVKSIK